MLVSVSAGVSLPNRPQIDPLAADLAATLLTGLILAVLCWRAPASAFGGAPEEQLERESGRERGRPKGGSIGARLQTEDGGWQPPQSAENRWRRCEIWISLTSWE